MYIYIYIYVSLLPSLSLSLLSPLSLSFPGMSYTKNFLWLIEVSFGSGFVGV